MSHRSAPLYIVFQLPRDWISICIMSDLLHLAAFLIPCIFVQRLVIDFISFLDLLNFDRDSLRFWLLNNFDGIKFIKLSFVFGDELSYNFLNIGSLSVKKQSLHFLNIFLQLFDSFSHYLYYRGFENLYQYQNYKKLDTNKYNGSG